MHQDSATSNPGRVSQTGGAAAAAFGDLAGAGGQFGHDGRAGLVAHFGPLSDFVDRAQAARAQARFGVDHADLDAGAEHLLACPDAIAPGSGTVRAANDAAGPTHPARYSCRRRDQ